MKRSSRLRTTHRKKRTSRRRTNLRKRNSRRRTTLKKRNSRRRTTLRRKSARRRSVSRKRSTRRNKRSSKRRSSRRKRSRKHRMKGGADAFALTDPTQRQIMKGTKEEEPDWRWDRETAVAGKLVRDAGIGSVAGAALGAAIGAGVGVATRTGVEKGARVGSSYGWKAGLGAGAAYSYYHNIPPEHQGNIKKALDEMKRILDLKGDITASENIDTIGGLIIGNADTTSIQERKPLAVLRRHFTNMGTSEDMLGVLYPVTDKETELREQKEGLDEKGLVSLTFNQAIKAVQKGKVTFLEHLEADSKFIGKLIVAGYLKHGAMANTRHSMRRLQMSDVEKQHREQGDVTDEELADLMSFVNSLPIEKRGGRSDGERIELLNENLTNAEKKQLILKEMPNEIVADYLIYREDHGAAAQLVETVKSEQIAQEAIAVLRDSGRSAKKDDQSDQSPPPMAGSEINVRYSSIPVHGNRKLIVETVDGDDVSVVTRKMRDARKKFYALEPPPVFADEKDEGEEKDIRKSGMDHVFIYDDDIIYVNVGEELDHNSNPPPLHKRKKALINKEIMEAKRKHDEMQTAI